MILTQPTVILSPLDRADGSASYSSNGYTIICGVNGPVEVQRRDELPEEAAIDVSIRPASGVGGVRERHLESVIQKTLRQIILVSAHPRTLLQVTLQVVSAQEDESKISGLPQAASNIDILPALLQTAMLALLSTAIPLSMTMTCTLIAINPHGALSPNPTAKQLSSAGSVHVLAFSSLGDLLVVESEGQFSFDAWEQVYAEARKICLGPQEEDNDGGDDVDMDDRDERRGESLQDVLRSAVKEKVRREGRWRDSLG